MFNIVEDLVVKISKHTQHNHAKRSDAAQANCVLDHGLPGFMSCGSHSRNFTRLTFISSWNICRGGDEALRVPPVPLQHLYHRMQLLRYQFLFDQSLPRGC
jgi:hypothetical protein